MVTQEIIDLLGDNWFKFAAKAGETDATLETRKKFAKLGTQIGMKEFMLLLWRNEASMAYSMEGRTLWEKKEEYYDTCRELIGLFLKSGEWVNRYGKSYPIGYEFSMKERWMITVNAVIKDALELEGDNGVEKKGSYAMFCLRVFAKDLLVNVKKNWVDTARFFVSDVPTMDDIVEDLDFEKAEEDVVLFDEAPVTEEAPEEDFEEPPMNADYLEFIMSQCPPDEDECDLVG